ncbi:hypothetical protein AMECASPLE_021019 [Ameca splendens]|uniref:Uncharacterized protein n=1 Tax=Ameca splendens TaxID=208324 RepID=A0ABV0Y3D2_9TELE
MVSYSVAGPKADRLGGSRVGSKTHLYFLEFTHLQARSRGTDIQSTGILKNGNNKIWSRASIQRHDKIHERDITTPQGTKDKDKLKYGRRWTRNNRAGNQGKQTQVWNRCAARQRGM